MKRRFEDDPDDRNSKRRTSPRRAAKPREAASPNKVASPRKDAKSNPPPDEANEEQIDAQVENGPSLNERTAILRGQELEDFRNGMQNSMPTRSASSGDLAGRTLFRTAANHQHARTSDPDSITSPEQTDLSDDQHSSTFSLRPRNLTSDQATTTQPAVGGSSSNSSPQSSSRSPRLLTRQEAKNLCAESDVIIDEATITAFSTDATGEMIRRYKVHNYITEIRAARQEDYKKKKALTPQQAAELRASGNPLAIVQAHTRFADQRAFNRRPQDEEGDGQ